MLLISHNFPLGEILFARNFSSWCDLGILSDSINPHGQRYPRYPRAIFVTLVERSPEDAGVGFLASTYH